MFVIIKNMHNFKKWKYKQSLKQVDLIYLHGLACLNLNAISLCFSLMIVISDAEFLLLTTPMYYQNEKNKTILLFRKLFFNHSYMQLHIIIPKSIVNMKCMLRLLCNLCIWQRLLFNVILYENVHTHTYTNSILSYKHVYMKSSLDLFQNAITRFFF